MADTWAHYPIVPAQATNQNGTAQNQLFQVGSALYYVVPVQFTGAGGLQISVMKSTNGGKTWALKANAYPAPPGSFPASTSGGYPAAVSGTSIYIFAAPGPPAGFVYDTVSDSFVSNIAANPDLNFVDGATASTFTTGTILVCYVDGADNLACSIYDPTSDTWGAKQIIAAAVQRPPSVQCVDPVSDTAFIFWVNGLSVLCAAITSGGAISGTVVAATLTNANEQCPGVPCVLNGEIILPYLDPYGIVGNVPNLYVVRSPVSPLGFGPPELVSTGVMLPPIGYSSSVAVPVGGMLYVAYASSNSVTPSPTPQASVMYQSSTVPGTWAAAKTAWTGPVSSLGLSLYALPIGATLGIMHPFVSPIAALTVNNSFSVLSRTNPPSSGGGGAGAMGGGFRGPGLGGCCDSGHTFQAARMLEMVRRSVMQKSAWPYIYEFAPPDSIPVEQIAQIPVPAIGVLTPVLTYLVPEGFRFFLGRLVEDFEGAAFAPFDALWTVDKDAVVPNVQGQPIQGLIQTPVPLGSFLRGVKWPLPRAYEFAPLTILRSTVLNQTLAGGAFVSGFFGYLVPAIGR